MGLDFRVCFQAKEGMDLGLVSEEFVGESLDEVELVGLKGLGSFLVLQARVGRDLGQVFEAIEVNQICWELEGLRESGNRVFWSWLLQQWLVGPPFGL